MATYNKYENFAGDLAGQVHDLLGTTPGTDCDTLKVALSNTAPNAGTHSVLADASEITAGNGYTAGGDALTNQSGTASGGTFTLAADENVWTASGGAIATFRYVILHNDTPTSPADPLISWWDHGEAVDLADGETFTWQPSSQASGGTVFTLS